MQQSDFEPRRRRWPIVLITVLLLLGLGWTVAWHYAAGAAEQAVADWRAREARAGRVYSCASQTIGGFPFGIELRCADAKGDLSKLQSPMQVEVKNVVAVADVWQPTMLTSTWSAPLRLSTAQADAPIVADWAAAEVTLHGLPGDPERVDVAVRDAELRVETAGEKLFVARRVAVSGKILEGTAPTAPIVQVVLKLAGAAAPTLHEATAKPIDADIAAVLRGLKDFSPKPLTEHFRELQKAGGRLDITSARVQQGDVVAVAVGALSISPRGHLDGQLRLTVANLEQLLPVLGIDQPQAQNAPMNSALNALDRLAPGLGNLARQNAPALVAGLSLLGQQTELEGKRAVVVPLRFSDGLVSLGPIPLGQMPPLYY
jgi:hypothetical protein